MLTPLCLTLVLAQDPTPAPREGERFGRALLTLHDLDGDGMRDFAVGAPVAAGEKRHSGRVLILSAATREVLQVWRGEPQREGFGHTLRAAGDANADGTQDVLVGYEFGDRTEVRSGADGALLHSFSRADHQVTAFGDLDGDGAADFLLVGERLEVRSGRDGAYLGGHKWNPGPGAFLPTGDLDADGLTDGVLLGEDAKLLRTGPLIEGARWSRFDHDARRDLNTFWGDAFANRSVRIDGAAPTGDLDGDGSRELLLRVRVEKRAELWALSPARASAWILDSDKLGALDDAAHSTGYATVALGDLDGDGYDDLVVAETARPFAVELKALSGKTGEELWRAAPPDGEATSGVSFALLPDTDGDGVDEVLVGISDWYWHGAVFRTGRLECLSGKSGRVLWSLGVDEVEVPSVEER